MSNIELLKKELLAQKEAIELMGGVVNVANLNPSPSEITEGIKTVSGLDTSSATATAEDVMVGKTFFAGNSDKKTGTFDLDKYTNELFTYDADVAGTTEKVYFTYKDGATQTRPYLFRSNKNPVEFTFNKELQDVGDYTFYDCENFTFKGFTELENLTRISTHAFYKCTNMSPYLESLPDTIQYLGQRSFSGVAQEGASIILPESLTTLSSYSFSAIDGYVKLKTLYVPSTYTQDLQPYVFQLLSFDSDFVMSDETSILGIGFNYRGSFNNVTIGANCTTVRDNCFGALSTDPISNFHLKTVTFNTTTVPYFGKTAFASQHKENGFKIYVLDELVEEFKAKSNFTTYADYIFPISEKE